MTSNPEFSSYLFSHFTGAEGRETDEQVYFALSRDGKRWSDTRPDGRPALTSCVGEKGVRDPFIIRAHDDGKFWLLATDLSIFHRGGWKTSRAKENGSTSIVIWESEDLAHWSQPRLADVASKIPGACFAWAPEASWDEDRQQYIIYWATGSHIDNVNGDFQNMYYATTEDFVTFSEPHKWIDRDSYCIDTTMMKAEDGWWYRASGDGEITIERTHNPYAVALSPSAETETGDGEHEWAYVGTLSSIFGTEEYSGAYLEGPEFFSFNEKDILAADNGKPLKYGLMCDQYRRSEGYLPFRSTDLSSASSADWEQPRDVELGPLKKRHGGILPITAEEFSLVQKTFATNIA